MFCWSSKPYQLCSESRKSSQLECQFWRFAMVTLWNSSLYWRLPLFKDLIKTVTRYFEYVFIILIQQKNQFDDVMNVLEQGKPLEVKNHITLWVVLTGLKARFLSYTDVPNEIPVPIAPINSEFPHCIKVWKLALSFKRKTMQANRDYGGKKINKISPENVAEWRELERKREGEWESRYSIGDVKYSELYNYWTGRSVSSLLCEAVTRSHIGFMIFCPE